MKAALGALLLTACATTNDVAEVRTTRKRNATLAAQAALSDCDGPVKLVLTQAIHKPRNNLIEITYRCASVERTGHAPEVADNLIQEIAANANKSNEGGKRQLLRIEHQELPPETP